MASPPIFSGREVVNIFGRDGWNMVRQRGSHSNCSFASDP